MQKQRVTIIVVALVNLLSFILANSIEWLVVLYHIIFWRSHAYACRVKRKEIITYFIGCAREHRKNSATIFFLQHLITFM